jgi:FAD/FMN-containing dehydrogenase
MTNLAVTVPGGDLRGFQLYIWKKRGVFKNLISRHYGPRNTIPAKPIFSELKLTPEDMAEIDYRFEALKPYLGRFRYVNYLDQDEEGDLAPTVYGPNLARLRAIKAQYDPDNFFHLNVNIKPAQGKG